jgi:hypothetical protein
VFVTCQRGLSLLGFEKPRLHHLHPKVGTLKGATIIMYELYARFCQRLEVTFISKSRSSSKKRNVISPAGRLRSQETWEFFTSKETEIEPATFETQLVLNPDFWS